MGLHEVDVTEAMELAAGILKAPAEAESLVMGFLAERIKNGAPEASLAVQEKLLDLIPETSGLLVMRRSPKVFKTIFEGEFSKLELRQTKFGREVRVTLYKGATTEMIMNEINRRCEERYKKPAIRVGQLYLNDKIKEVLSEDEVVTFIPCISGSADRYREGRKADIFHSEFLKEMGLGFVDVKHLVAAAGGFRYARGFRNKHNRKGDTGDLFRGFSIRANDGIVASEDHLIGGTYYDSGYSDPELAVAGKWI